MAGPPPTAGVPPRTFRLRRGPPGAPGPGPSPQLSSATLTLPMLIHCACGGATQPLTMASQQEDPNGSADQPTAGGDATGAVAPDPFVDAFSGRLDLDVVERKRERPLPLPPTHLAMWQQCNVAISQYRNPAIPQSRTANAPMLPPPPPCPSRFPSAFPHS